MFSGGGNILITGGSFTQNLHQEKGINLLRDKVASGAFHNSDERYDPPKCHPGTRKAVINDVMEWVKTLDREQFFLWLYGPAGAGKSAIAQSVAEFCSNLGLLAASFFFSRTAPGRNDISFFIPTLAYQLTTTIPGMAEQVSLVIEKDPLVLSRSVKAQLEELVLQPLSKLYPNQNSSGKLESHPRLIIIDGLDECGDGHTQRYILETLSSSLQNYTIPLIFLIASRPEQEIRDAFNDDKMDSLTRRLVLDDHYLPDADIQLFLESKFEAIKKSHPLHLHLPTAWPTESEMEALIQKSSGQFIYASTGMKFVQSPRHRPTERLNIILGLSKPSTQTPFSELDALYTHIFASTDDIDKVLDIFTYILLVLAKAPDTLFPQMSMDSIEKFLEYQPGDLQIILTDLHSVLFVPLPDSQERNLRIYHASLGDFLMDRSRSGKFFVVTPKAFARMAVHCVNHASMIPELLATAEGDSVNMKFEALDFIFRLSFIQLMDLCTAAHPTEELLQVLASFSFDKFLTLPSISFATGIDGPYLHFFPWKLMATSFPAFMIWLQQQIFCITVLPDPE
ncbi:hypothetical protein GALMADRAFT_1062229 [Galerina marginata CBS 339.88]|uniref:Nephrocystin 3-like N-terminal domain-containing protein n=1 Tax=Galerina marginata (strain CBS 339.88) TaxID=685588 RepID=A0A067SCT8_GALM3|nr:hypothetical protein GALMADRAFT_1062229 [Galerina marginata CBS 339.88]